MLDQRRDQLRVVLEPKRRLPAFHRAEELLAPTIDPPRVQDLAEGLGQLPAQRLLGDVVGRAGPEGLDGDFLAAVRGHQDHGEAGIFLADALDQGQAVHAGHLEVGQDDGRRLAGDRLERLLAVAGVGRPEPGELLDDRPGDPAVDQVVVDDQHDGGGVGFHWDQGLIVYHRRGFGHGFVPIND